MSMRGGFALAKGKGKRAASPVVAFSSKRRSKRLNPVVEEESDEDGGVSVEDGGVVLSDATNGDMEAEYENSDAGSDGEDMDVRLNEDVLKVKREIEEDALESHSDLEADEDAHDSGVDTRRRKSTPRRKTASKKGKAKAKAKAKKVEKDEVDEGDPSPQAVLDAFLQLHPELEYLDLVVGKGSNMKYDFDCYDPKTYKILDLGGGKSNRWRGMDMANMAAGNDLEQCVARFEEALENEIRIRQAQVAGGDCLGVISPSDVKVLQTHTLESLVRMISMGMDKNTKGVLGRYTFTELDMEDMNGFDADDLESSIVYGFYFFFKHWKGDETDDDPKARLWYADAEKSKPRRVLREPPNEKYVGKSTNERGSAVRIGRDYERGAQKAMEGVASSYLYLNTVVQRAVVEGVRVYGRPLYKPCPDDGVNDMLDGAKAEFVEGVMADIERSLVEDGRVIREKKNGEILNDGNIEAMSVAAAPGHRQKSWKGLNKVHPWAQSSKKYGGPGAAQVKAAEYDDANGIALCPICKKLDMHERVNTTEPAVLIDYEQQYPWFTAKVACCKCYSWLRAFSDYTKEALEKCESMADLVKYRQTVSKAMSAQWKTDLRREQEARFPGCVLCCQPMETQRDGETRADFDARLSKNGTHHMKAMPPGVYGKTFPFLKDSRMHSRCYRQFYAWDRTDRTVSDAKLAKKARFAKCKTLDDARRVWRELHPEFYTAD